MNEPAPGSILRMAFSADDRCAPFRKCSELDEIFQEHGDAGGKRDPDQDSDRQLKFRAPTRRNDVIHRKRPLWSLAAGTGKPR